MILMTNMLSGLKEATNVAYTTNGARAYKTTESALVDFFSKGGALRNASESEVISLFTKAYAENPLYAMKALFYIRDVRGGQGERETFKRILRYMAINHTNEIANNVWAISEYGRFDDLYVLFGTPLEEYSLNLIKGRLLYDLDQEHPSLLAKWLPSENASSPTTKALAKKIRSYLGLTPRQYRQTLSALRRRIDIVESKMSSSNWDTIEYDKLPSKAGLQYRNAFLRHDSERYTDFITKVSNGESKINVNTLFPYEIIEKFPISMQITVRNQRMYNAIVGSLDATEEMLLDGMWKNLPDYVGSNFENALAVIDTSGSMTGTPIQVALSLGLYLAERNKGEFHNHFVTFSRSPELQAIQGTTLGEKIRNMSTAEWQQNTDIEKVFELILNTAIKKGLSQSELPTKLFIISDMQFDGAVRGRTDITLINSMRASYASHGYNLPELIFWQVNAVGGNFPVKVTEAGVALVSGCSPSIFKNLLAGKDMTPYSLMMDVLDSERYILIN
jgi:hypothetical protein